MTIKNSKNFWYALLFTIGYSLLVGLMIVGYLVQQLDRPLSILMWPWSLFAILLGKPQRPAYVIWAFRYFSFGFGIATLVSIWAGFSPSIFYLGAIAILLLAFIPQRWLDKIFKPKK